MGHTHSHETGDFRSHAKKSLSIATALTLALFLAEFIGGLLSNSLALLSDAGHMLADLVALTLSLLSIHWATKPATARKTYGYFRIEVLATLVNGALLFYVALQILWEAIHRFATPEGVEVRVMLPVAIAGLLVNVVTFAILRKGSDHLVMKSALYHVLSDLLSSVGVVVTGFLIHLTGLKMLDTVASVLISILISINAIKLLRETFDILMEASPRGIALKDVRQAILSVSGVQGVHDLHVWTIGANFHALSVHVLIQNMTTLESDQIVRNISSRLQKDFSISHATVQVASAPAPATITTIAS